MAAPHEINMVLGDVRREEMFETFVQVLSVFVSIVVIVMLFSLWLWAIIWVLGEVFCWAFQWSTGSHSTDHNSRHGRYDPQRDRKVSEAACRHTIDVTLARGPIGFILPSMPAPR